MTAAPLLQLAVPAMIGKCANAGCATTARNTKVATPVRDSDVARLNADWFSILTSSFFPQCAVSQGGVSRCLLDCARAIVIWVGGMPAEQKAPRSRLITGS